MNGFARTNNWYFLLLAQGNARLSQCWPPVSVLRWLLIKINAKLPKGVISDFSQKGRVLIDKSAIGRLYEN